MSDPSGSLIGKTLFIGGVGPQIGAATAVVAAREGAQVALAARSTDTVESVAAAIRAAGGSAITLRCDLTSESDVQTAVAATIQQLGRLDAVFYNAAHYDVGHTDVFIDQDEWRRSMSVNLEGAMCVARAAVPTMLEQGSGSFVFTSSGASTLAQERMVAYGVTKAGLESFTRYIAGRYGRDGIRANGVLPLVVDGQAAEVFTRFNCLGRSGTAEEVAEVVAFLCSDRASAVTGEIVHVDGGLLARAPWASEGY